MKCDVCNCLTITNFSKIQKKIKKTVLHLIIIILIILITITMNKGTTSNHKQLTILRCKLVIIGDACVGKTALTQVFQSGGSTYPKNYLMVSLRLLANLEYYKIECIRQLVLSIP